MKQTFEERQNFVFNYVKIAIKSFKKHMSLYKKFKKHNYITRALIRVNNKIKVIKRFAFNYRCFYHFQNTIFTIQDHITMKKA